MDNLIIGDIYTLKKPTFLYQGILILKNSPVELVSIQTDNKTVSIRYIDKEQNPHIIDNIEAKYIQ